jgi:hypothetical protein
VLTGSFLVAFKCFTRGEISELMRLVRDAREIAINRLKGEADQLGARGRCRRQDLHRRDWPWSGRIRGIGTAVKKIARVGVDTPTLPVQAIVPDKDTWIDGDFGLSTGSRELSHRTRVVGSVGPRQSDCNTAPTRQSRAGFLQNFSRATLCAPRCGDKHVAREVVAAHENPYPFSPLALFACQRAMPDRTAGRVPVHSVVRAWRSLRRMVDGLKEPLALRRYPPHTPRTKMT